MFNDVGCVVYKKGDESGTLHATWCHSSSGAGTGEATGGPAEGFAGRYHIRYFDDTGHEVADRELDIQKEGTHYTLTWMRHGEVSGRGIGLEVVEGLAAGYL